MTRSLSALIVESQELFGTGLKHLVARDRSRLKAHVFTGLDAALREMPAGTHMRLAILDVGAPGVAGAASTAAIRERFPCARIILTTASASRRDILEYLAWAVHGVILTTQSASEIANAIRLVMSGGVFVPPAVCEPPVPVVEAAPWPPEDRPADEQPAHLSSRQSAVLRLLARGLSNKAIARELALSEGTVKVHVAALYKALNVHNRAGAIASMTGLGLNRVWHACLAPLLLVDNLTML